MAESQLNRRDACKTMLGGIAASYATTWGVFAGTGLSQQQVVEAREAGRIADGGGSSFEQEIEELLAFHRGLSGIESPSPAGYSLPCSVMPRSVTPRLTQKMIELPEPNIPLLHASLLKPDPASQQLLAAAMNTLTDRLRLPPAVWCCVKDNDLLKRHYPDGTPMRYSRVVTPKYTADVDELRTYGFRVTAGLLLTETLRLWGEWYRRVTQATDYLVAKCGSPREKLHLDLQFGPIEVYLHREAFTLTFYSYNLAAGYLAVGDAWQASPQRTCDV